MEFATTPLGSSAGLSNDDLESLAIDSVDDTSSLAIADYLTNNTSLRSLHVSFAEECNASTVLIGAMRHPRLQSLTLANVYMENDAAKIIQMMFTYNGTLREFTISTSNAVDICYVQDILLGLSRAAFLDSVNLYINNCTLDRYTCITLREVFEQNRTLRRLNLGRCHVASTDCVKEIGAGIVSNSNLQSLCGLYIHGARGASAFVEALQHNKTPQEVFPSCPAMDFYVEQNRGGHSSNGASYENLNMLTE
jgi:hypothetical protein